MRERPGGRISHAKLYGSESREGVPYEFHQFVLIYRPALTPAIGRAAAIIFAQEGAHIVVSGVETNKGKS